MTEAEVAKRMLVDKNCIDCKSCYKISIFYICKNNEYKYKSDKIDYSSPFGNTVTPYFSCEFWEQG